MSIFQKITLASLKKNKTRTIVTIIGVILSTAMICAMTTTFSSFKNFLFENLSYVEGSWHGGAVSADKDTLDDILSSDEIAEAVYGEGEGYAPIKGLEDSGKPYFYVMGISDNFTDIMPVHLTSGDLPKNENEIIIPEHLSVVGGITYKIGDVLTLDLGKRTIDGHVLNQMNPYISDDASGTNTSGKETFTPERTKEYKIVGFYARPGFEGYSSPGYTAITALGKDAPADADYDVYFTMNEPADVYSFMESRELTGYTNSNILMLLGCSRYDAFYQVIYSLMGIALVLILFGSVALIYNAFSISVSERTKQFGLLSSVGATKRQIRKMVSFEALFVSLIGIPLGILVGIGVIGVTFIFIGNNFTLLGANFVFPMKLCVSLPAVLIACAIALITVLISAWIPSVRAAHVSAIDAIRQTQDITNKAKNVKTSKITYKLFGLPGVLANKHFKHSKKRYRITIVSLFLSIVLFISASAFCEYLTRSVEAGFNTNPYDLIYAADMTDSSVPAPGKLSSVIKSENSVSNAAYSINTPIYCIASKDAVTDAYNDSVIASGGDISHLPEDTVSISASACFIEDSVYKEFLKENGLDVNEYTDAANPKAVAINTYTAFDYKEEKLKTIDILKDSSRTVTYDPKISDEYLQKVVDPEIEAASSVQLNIGTVIYDVPFFCVRSSDMILLYPDSMRSTLLPECSTNNTYYYIAVKSDDHAKSYKAIKSTLQDMGLSTSDLSDYAEAADTQRNIVFIIQVFAYGFVVLISLIAMANVFNTISTNISLRRREFAMLRSVGMTKNGFIRMMNYECLLYGTKALLYGLPVSLGITYLMYRSVSYGHEASFILPVTAIIIAVVSVFAIVFATMLYSMHKILKENTIDVLTCEVF